MLETRIAEYHYLDQKRVAIGREDGTILVFFNDGKFWLCDKEFGVQICENNQYRKVKRIFKGSSSVEVVGGSYDGNCNKKR